MPTWDDVVAIARTLPQTEVGLWYGTPGLKVAGKGFARWRTESDHGLMVLCTLEEKARLLASGEAAYYTTPHYDGFGSILINLTLVDPTALVEFVTGAWRLKAPRSVAGAVTASDPKFSALTPEPRRRTRRPRRPT